MSALDRLTDLRDDLPAGAVHRGLQLLQRAGEGETGPEEFGEAMIEVLLFARTHGVGKFWIPLVRDKLETNGFDLNHGRRGEHGETGTECFAPCTPRPPWFPHRCFSRKRCRDVR